jgi:hypothetical protein
MVSCYVIYLFVSHCTLYFHLNVVFLFQLDSTFGTKFLTFNLLTCECGHKFDAFDM